MWNFQAKLRHQYLHKSVPDTNAIVLNRCVCHVTEGRDHENCGDGPILLLPASYQPTIYGVNVDKTRSRIAYGRWGIPQLIRFINDENLEVRLTSLLSLSDEIHDPEKLKHAYRLYVVKRLLDNLVRTIKVHCCADPIKSQEIEFVFLSFVIISEDFGGACLMLSEQKLMDMLCMLLKYPKPNIIQRTIKIFSIMTKHKKIADDMIKLEYLKLLKLHLKFIENFVEFYILLGHLFESSPDAGIEDGYFEILLPKLYNKSDYQLELFTCFGILVNTIKAQMKCDNIDIVKFLYSQLKDERLDHEILHSLVTILQNVTLSTKSRWRCREFWDLTLILIELAHSKENDNLQLVCLQTLRQLTELPSVKNFVRKVGKKRIKNIVCCKQTNRIKRDELLDWLRKKYYPTEERESDDDHEDDTDKEKNADKRRVDFTYRLVKTQPKQEEIIKNESENIMEIISSDSSSETDDAKIE